MADRIQPKPMTMEQVGNAIQELVQDATSYMEAELSPQRAKATEYNRGDPLRNEETGRSQIVLTVVRDVVGAVKPSLVRLFLPTSGHIIRYDARPTTQAEIASRVQAAEQATEYVNSVVLNVDNNGHLELSNAFEDGLVRKVGFLKAYWEDRSSYQSYTARGCDVLQYEALQNDDDVEITKATKRTIAPTVAWDTATGQAPSGAVPMWDVEYKQWRREGVPVLKCTPPEEVLVSRDARSRDEATFLAHKTEKTKSELIAMGVPEQVVDDFGGLSSEMRGNIEEIARRGGIVHIDQAPQPQLKRHLWIEAYPYLDIDGDGIAELVQVNCIGPDCHVVGEPEPIAERPFALFCPFPQPHVLFGESLADRVMDLQLMESSVLRAAADGLSMSIFPRRYYTEGSVDKQAMDSTAISQDVPVFDGLPPAQAVMVENFEWKGQDALALLGFLKQTEADRVGPTPTSLDPDSLQSTPQLGVKAVVQAASEQVELIARNFAATGMKQLGRLLLRLLVEHQPRKRIVRLRGQYVEIDPHAWDAEMDVSINVALGTQEKLGILAANVAKQEQVLQLLGPTNPLVTVGQLVHSYRTMLEMAGVADVGSFWNDVPPDWAPPPQPPSPDPNMVLAQAETVKAQAALAKAEADFTLKKAEQMQASVASMTDDQFRAAEIALKREEMHLTDQRERDKAEADVAVKIAVANAQFQGSITMKQIDADIAREQMVHDAVIALKPEPPPENGPKKKAKAPA